MQQENAVERLRAAFPASWIKTSDQAGRGKFKYLDARDVEERLDDLFGPECWQFTWELVAVNATGAAVKARLEIYFEWRGWIGKEDAGEYHIPTKRDGTLAQGVDDMIKSAVTDAMRRCGSKWGIARYLYAGRDAPRVSTFANASEHNPEPAQRSAEAAPAADKPKGGHKGADTARPAAEAQETPEETMDWMVALEGMDQAELTREWSVMWERAMRVKRRGVAIEMTAPINLQQATAAVIIQELAALRRRVLAAESQVEQDKAAMIGSN